MPKLDDQIHTLQERLAQLKLRQQRSEARQRALDAARERKQEMRRKMLLGAVALDKLHAGGGDGELLLGWLDQALTRAADRAAFGLPPREQAQTGD